jgi:hypothetical protein
MTMTSPEPPQTRSSGISTDARSLLIACLGLAVIGFAFFHYVGRFPPSLEPHVANAQVGPPPAESTPWTHSAAYPEISALPGRPDAAGNVPQPKEPPVCPWAHDRAVDGELPRDYSVNCPHWQRWTHDPAYDIPHRHHPREPEILEIRIHRAGY